jgi:hypothetical protein
MFNHSTKSVQPPKELVASFNRTIVEPALTLATRASDIVRLSNRFKRSDGGYRELPIESNDR